MGNRFSIEELTCLHLLRCHYADICGKEERELRETIALHPATFAKAKMIVRKKKKRTFALSLIMQTIIQFHLLKLA